MLCPYNVVYLREKNCNKGTLTNKLSNIVGWASSPPYELGGLEAHPTRNSWIFFYLEIPKQSNGHDIIA